MVRDSLLTKIKCWAVHNWFMLILIVFSFFLLFASLGTAYAPIDEANTMVLSKNTMDYGLPVVWDGEYLVSPFFAGDITAENIWISHPWLQFYVTAASFKLLGTTTFAARFPFAVAGLLSIIAIYFLAKLMSDSKHFAQLTSVLLALNTAFLLYSRQSRYYSLTFLFSILTLYTFLRWMEKPNIKNMIFFVLSSALLFHSYYPFWVFFSLVIGIYGLLCLVVGHRWSMLKGFIIGHLALALLTLTWFIYAMPHAPLDTGPDLNLWIKNFKIYMWKLNTWTAPVYTLAIILLLMVLVKIMLKVLLKKDLLMDKYENEILHINKTYLLFLSIPLYIAFISVIPILTTQYAMPAIPFMTMLAAFLIWKIREYNKWVGGIVLAICLTTNIWNIAPYIFLEKSGIDPKVAENVIPNSRCDFVEGSPLDHYLKDEMVIRSYLGDHVSSLFKDYDNRIEGIVTYLNEHGSKDQTVLSFWGDANAIRFYTGMNVVYEFFPLYDNPEMEKLVYKPGTKIDWIIYDTLNFYPAANPFFKFNLDDYETIKINYPKEYHDNVPNLDFFKFKTNYDAPQSFYILKHK